MLGDARVGAAREDPGPRGFGGLEKAFPQTPFQPWLQLEVGLPARDGDQELGLLQAPLAEEEGQHQLRLRVVRQSDVLCGGRERKYS